MRVAWIAVIAGCGFQAHAVPGSGSAAVAPDAGFDPAQCPASYSADLPGPSRYRVIVEGHPAWTQSDACAADLPGATHLVVLETADELARVAALVAAPPQPIAGNAIWIGAVQPRSAMSPGEGWLRFDGAPVAGGWGGSEPNDRGDGEADHDEQFVKIDRTRRYLIDAAGGESDGALCECDGAAIAAIASDAITASRP